MKGDMSYKAASRIPIDKWRLKRGVMSRPLVMDNRYVDSMTVLNAFKSAWGCLLESVALEEGIDCLKETERQHITPKGNSSLAFPHHLTTLHSLKSRQTPFRCIVSLQLLHRG